MRSIAMRIVAVQLAAALLIAGLAVGVGGTMAALPVTFLLLVLAGARVRGQWVHAWISQGTRYLARRRFIAAGADAATLLDLVRPAATMTSIEADGASIGVVEDVYGLSAVIEVGDTSGLLGEARAPVPALTALLPGLVGDQPAIRIQLLVAAVAAGSGAGPSATSYRQLTEGRIVARQRTFIGVHARRVGGFGDGDVEAALIGAVRRVRRRLDRDRLPNRPLAAETVLRILGELAHHDPAHPVRESWSTLEAGGLRQATFRLSRWPDPQTGYAETLVPRLLTLPGAGTTITLIAERSAEQTRDQRGADHTRAERGAEPMRAEQMRARPGTDVTRAERAANLARAQPGVDLTRGQPGAEPMRAELAVRVAARSSTELGNAISALRRLLDNTGAAVTRLDGAQLDGLGATLPLGGAPTGPDAALSGLLAGHDALAIAGGTPLKVSPETLAAIEPPVGGEGLMLGVNRKGEPVVVRLFRPEPTRAALIGGLRCAETIVLRALAVGAQVIVQSGRPQAWEPFLRGLSGGEPITLVPPGQIVEPVPATPVRPQLLVVDIGPIGPIGMPVVESTWRATMLVRDDLTAADLDILARADLVLLQPLSPQEATLAASALGLGDSAGWLTRIRADMLGVVVARRTLRWALLSTTPVERHLIGAAQR